MKYIVAFGVAAIIGALSYLALNKELASKLRVFKPTDVDEEYVSKNLSFGNLIFGSVLQAAIAFVSVLQIFSRVNDPIGISKMVIALACMAVAACFDFREKRIPNIFPLVLSVAAIIMLAIGVVTKQNGAIAYITSSVVASVGCVVILSIAAFLTRQGIGAGDIKLIGALSLMCGVNAIIGTLMCGMICCCAVAIVALILKKKTTKEGIPFGPFLYIGFVLTLFVMNF